ncbi:MAG: AmmeMemoRadiSam system radical SAM enzyme [Deltaproteobacteria bacterium]|nr:AmmeMemoRadiSam system radical SAM enzyme [Deltaproteobacteria bacterium]
MEVVIPQSEMNLKEVLTSLARPGELYEKLPDGKLLCYACGHRCKIPEGHEGICRVRFNRDGILYVPKGYAGAIQLDPVEKKPFYHAYPGTRAMSFGMLGCDFHCGYCQNWVTSQAMRDPHAVAPVDRFTPREIIDLARRHQAEILTSTYNEPLITSEWAVDIFKEAKKEGFITSYVSNGNGTPEVIEYIRPWVDLYKVDLKSFNDKNYRSLGGVLANVLKTIEMLHGKGFWLEVLTLIIPGFNDSDEELKGIARFLSGVSPIIPWHVTAFHKDYKMTDPDNTPPETLIRACEIGAAEGLKFIYSGNLPGQTGKWENTWCPQCGELLIERVGFRVTGYHLNNSQCPRCNTTIPGRFWPTEKALKQLDRQTSVRSVA